MFELQNILPSVLLATTTSEPPTLTTFSLTWRRCQRYRVSSPPATDHDLSQRVASLLHRDASLSRCCVRRVQLMQHDDRDVFWRIHRAEAESLKRNKGLRVSPPSSSAAKAACAVLDTFAAKTAPHLRALVNDPANDGSGGLSKIVFAWYGTSEKRLDAVCRDGLHVMRGRDSGYFGAGVYWRWRLITRAATLARRCVATSSNLRHSSCTHAPFRKHTLSRWRRTTGRRDDCGFSRFCDGTASRPLEAKYDAHVIPVRNCGTYHPWDGETPAYRNLDYQAATEQHPDPAMRPTAHELVLSKPLRCTPIALVEVGPRIPAA
jgi:hypothetical protein